MKEETRDELINQAMETVADGIVDSGAIDKGIEGCLAGCASMILLVGLPVAAAVVYLVA